MKISRETSFGAAISLIGGVLIAFAPTHFWISVLVLIFGLGFLLHSLWPRIEAEMVRHRVEYQEGGILWRVWIRNDPTDREIKGYCAKSHCDGPLIANPRQRSYCTVCGGKYVAHGEYNKTKEEVLVRATGDWHNGRKGYVLETPLPAKPWKKWALAFGTAGVVVLSLVFMQKDSQRIQKMQTEDVADLIKAREQDENVCLNCAMWCSRVRSDTTSLSFDRGDVCFKAGCCEPALQERIWKRAESQGFTHPLVRLKKVMNKSDAKAR